MDTLAKRDVLPLPHAGEGWDEGTTNRLLCREELRMQSRATPLASQGSNASRRQPVRGDDLAFARADVMPARRRAAKKA